MPKFTLDEVDGMNKAVMAQMYPNYIPYPKPSFELELFVFKKAVYLLEMGFTISDVEKQTAKLKEIIQTYEKN